MDLTGFGVEVKHGVRSKDVSAVSVKFTVRPDAVLCAQTVHRSSQEFDYVEQLIHALVRKDLSVEKGVSVLEKVFNVRDERTCRPSLVRVFVGNKIPVPVVGVTVGFRLFEVLFEAAHEGVGEAERFDDPFADLFMCRFFRDFAHDKPCEDIVRVDVCPRSSGLEVEPAVDVFNDIFRIHDVTHFLNAGCVVEKHTDGDFVSLFKIGEPFVDRLVEVDFSILLQKEHRYSSEVLRDAADFEKVIGQQFLFCIAVADAYSEGGEFVVAVSDYNAGAVGET